MDPGYELGQLFSAYFGWIVFGWLLCGAATSYIAAEKGYAQMTGCVAGGVFGLLGLLWVGLLPDRKLRDAIEKQSNMISNWIFDRIPVDESPTMVSEVEDAMHHEVERIVRERAERRQGGPGEDASRICKQCGKVRPWAVEECPACRSIDCIVRYRGNEK